MKQWFKIERIPGVLASTYEKATRLVIDTYYCEVAKEVVAHLDDGIILDIGTGPGYLPIEIAKPQIDSDSAVKCFESRPGRSIDFSNRKWRSVEVWRFIF